MDQHKLHKFTIKNKKNKTFKKILNKKILFKTTKKFKKILPNAKDRIDESEKSGIYKIKL